MSNGKPELIAIDHDDYHAEHIGLTPTGHQFFLTNPFEPAMPNKAGCEYIALFLFDSEGNLVDSDIETLGARGSYSEEAATQKYYDKLRGLGDVTFQRIEVKPFSVGHNGTNIGLIIREPEEDCDVWAVELLPGNYMAFFEPWDSGYYDT